MLGWQRPVKVLGKIGLEYIKAQTRLSRHLEGCDPPNTHRMPREVLMARTVDRPEEVGREKVNFDRQRR